MSKTQRAAPAHDAGAAGVAPFGRRNLLSAALAAAAAVRTRPARAAAATADWVAFRQRFVMPDGRVIDTGNSNVSHSEGQGAALLFAARFDDRVGFERILAWTRGVLRRPDDTLLAWRYQPGASVPVADLNNATDGDLLAAWALSEAAGRWGVAEHRALAIQMGRDILRRVVVAQGKDAVLLPGASGFLKPDHVVVNPSYSVLPAFRAMALLVPNPLWARLEESGLALSEAACFGRWKLPADWVALPRGAGRPTLASGWAPRFSYDAIRVPLYLAWAGYRQAPTLRAAVEFWNDPAHAAPPAWADLRTDAVAPYAGDAGLRAIGCLAGASSRRPAGVAAGGATRAASLPEVSEAQSYYAGLLVMMSRLAWSDAGLEEDEQSTAALTPRPAPLPRTGVEARLATFLAPTRF
ncbi:glycosyl hydrolase family 8 [Muricoccus vinaceus]|uniref:cellulase n=1 Tax=Muricoccus vinaceus TaxID=424704 RepID=A0ABV6INC9_9PROT